ncbi:IS110 family transposase [Bradyrhizobium sp. CNPSo 4019]|uniref:IS110 family transposase n=1 Tax=Bradyrhizobium diversitatis TaxID=2755406 RepID=A0ABS0PG30_9BRAD|nr:IS110 family transposase [Bradyrhizobium diversitatis]MBH5391937.1 IS110 family transposase [Bradyrhizobium diversitatis]
MKRLGLLEAFKLLPPSIVGMEACLSAHFVSRALRQLGHQPRIIPAIYVKPFVKGQKNDYNDAEAIGTINQIRAFLIEQGIAVRTGATALRNSLLAILENRQDEISPRMRDLIVGLHEDWIHLDERIEALASEIDQIGEKEANCQRLMSVPGIGPLISTAVVAAIGTGEAFERGRDFGAWLGLVPRQYSTGGRSILGRISKRGSKYLRTLFIQAANVILMRPHNWNRFSFGAWLQNAAPRLHRNKLATALANKLARIAWSILRNEKTFDAPNHEVIAI